MANEPTAEELALARRVVAAHFRQEGHWASEDTARQYEQGLADHHIHIQIALAAIRETTALAAKLVEREQQDFLSPEYATGQPMASFQERFACGQIIEALRTNAHLKGEAHDA